MEIYCAAQYGILNGQCHRRCVTPILFHDLPYQSGPLDHMLEYCMVLISRRHAKKKFHRQSGFTTSRTKE